MPTIHRISDLTLERRGGPDPRLYVRFKMSEPPDKSWIDLFKAHAASSVFGATNMIIVDSDVSVEVARPSSTAELATAMDCFIECANLGLRSFGGPASQQKFQDSSRARIVADRARPYRFS
jgi:hypothetical protein